MRISVAFVARLGDRSVPARLPPRSLACGRRGDGGREGPPPGRPGDGRGHPPRPAPAGVPALTSVVIPALQRRVRRSARSSTPSQPRPTTASGRCWSATTGRPDAHPRDRRRVTSTACRACASSTPRTPGRRTRAKRRRCGGRRPHRVLRRRRRGRRPAGSTRSSRRPPRTRTSWAARSTTAALNDPEIADAARRRRRPSCPGPSVSCRTPSAPTWPCWRDVVGGDRRLGRPASRARLGEDVDFSLARAARRAAAIAFAPDGGRALPPPRRRCSATRVRQVYAYAALRHPALPPLP